MNEFCRTCMCQFPHNSRHKIETYHIFEIHNLADKLMQCSKLRVLPYDGYPRSLCGKCYEKILDFSEFQRMCRESLKAFKEILLLEKKVCYGNYIEQNATEYTEHNIVADAKMKMSFTDDGLDETINNNQIVENTMEDEFIFEDDYEVTSVPNSHIDTVVDNTPLKVVGDIKDVIPIQLGNDTKSLSTMIQSPKCIENEESYVADNENKISKKFLECEDECVVDTLSGNEENEAGAELHGFVPKYISQHQFQCDLCPKAFEINHHLVAHKQLHQGLTAYPCPRENCTNTYRRLFDLRLHLKEHDGLPREIYKCDIDHCGKEYASKAAINMHIRKQHNNFDPSSGSRKQICEICGASLANVRSLQDHYFVHVDKSLWPFGCKVEGCTSRFRNISQLREHKNRHDGIKPYVCPYCDKRFFTSSNLNVHVNCHTMERKWQCSRCPKICYNSAGLKQHIRRKHNADMGFPCRMCDETLPSFTARKYHEMAHNGEEQFSEDSKNGEGSLAE